MTTLKPFSFRILPFVLGAAVLLVSAAPLRAEEPKLPKPILLTEPRETIEVRMNRKIALDVRDMNIVDVIKFLAMKGDFNVIVSPAVDGRTTVLLDNVGIKDALDIVVVSNRLAYSIQNDIIQVMTSVEYEAMFGKQFGDKTVVETLHLQYAKPSYVLATLDNIKSNVGKIVIDEDTGSLVLIDTPESIAKMKKVVLEIEQPLETMVYSLQYAKADVVADKLRMRIDAKSVGSITADERSNQLVVRVFPGRKDEIEKIVRHLDEPTKEVLIEARILQVILKPQYDMGIDWSLLLKNKSIHDMTVGFGSPAAANLDGTFGKVQVGTVNAGNFLAQIKAMNEVSDTKILSNPKILAINNEEARIHIGDTVPYIISTTVGTANPVISEDVRFVDVGLKLSVTPTINDDGMVTLRLKPEISSVVLSVKSTNSANEGGIPQVNKTEIETTVLVEDGTTIVLAGLRKDDKKHTKTGIPILGEMPLLGKLFSNQADETTSTEIVIFITPHIMTGKENYKESSGSIKPSKSYN
ncbi:MAG: type II secretion system protein GspD [Candidatus Omnitrophica bacterium]|nr:type II secretion system protein GspD [Candidatus Omnitrophota bacterium]